MQPHPAEDRSRRTADLPVHGIMRSGHRRWMTLSATDGRKETRDVQDCKDEVINAQQAGIDAGEGELIRKVRESWKFRLMSSFATIDFYMPDARGFLRRCVG